ncbi:hypothetical protein TGS27_2112 [Geobacillus stearothermophilus]|uniref:Uncharacterized protein n=1 Tax=Geobacillus stearothermophilus TaxID=1422 RepID=A0A150MFW9_GEOSE|nr:hypothetical protein GS8_2647 [Geobacillus stearothermophilus]KYD23391.1 hypothetical protein B4109_2359 [Geobacillus stearothermophilus]OAO79680.1 hypothetical protein TGS27_2112 [Geobacillus stearothermophilus]
MPGSPAKKGADSLQPAWRLFLFSQHKNISLQPITKENAA